ncbi:hypothetical protein GALMADRAFT_215412 [Galerina marginata CBS 339.88]|uniref:Uncharacterized protein n=1 Tax=Galerina marginata (strain CBS 339.88) TaxID=685588 RepID=A0A067SDZ3_GALM3|nr:hypothetical protein GALMADRAFT_215412 [Galerina marginata CBS 339.88]
MNTNAPVAPCTVCANPSCAYFVPDVDNVILDMCFCGHLSSTHRAPNRLGPRGGYPARACTEFRPIGGAPITNFHQLCQCGGHYSAHQRQENNPVPTFRVPGPVPAPTTQPMASQTAGSVAPVMGMPVITEYQRVGFGVPTPFGVPLTAPPSRSAASGSSRQPASRRRIANPNGTLIVTRRQHLEITMTFVVLPRDLDQIITPQDKHGLENYTCLTKGERLSQDLAFLEEQGLTHTFTLRDIDNTEVDLLERIILAFNEMLANASYSFPEFDSNFSLPPGAPSRAERIAFERLQFNLVRISNQSTVGNRLVLDQSTNHRYFTHKNLKGRFKRHSNVHPTDISKGGLLVICPRNGGQLVGPIDGTGRQHHCFTDFILAGLAKSAFSKDLAANKSKTIDELEDEWKAEYSYHCRTTCPQQPRSNLFLPEDGESDNDDREIINTLSIQPLTTQREPSSGPRRSNRLAITTPPSTSTTLSPLVSLLDVGPAPFPMEPPSPTLDHHTPLPPPSQPAPIIPPVPQPPSQPVPIFLLPAPQPRVAIPVPLYDPPAGRQPDYNTFQEFENYVNAHRCPNVLLTEDFFKVEGDSVRDAATGLVVALMNVYGKADDAPLISGPLEPLRPTETFTGSIGPNDATLKNIFSYQHWHVRGGLLGDDSVGGGVMRQVLSEAIQIVSRDIVEDLDNDDGYVTLKISADGIVSETTVNSCFALGALCTIFMVKAHAAPEPISPALIQAAIGPCRSVQERKWVRSIAPPIAAILDLLPTPVNFRHPIPDCQELRSLVRRRFPGTSFNAILGVPPDEAQRVLFNAQFFTCVLLGVPENAIQNALEFIAFSQGINLHLTPAIPSFTEAITKSSKYLLARSYSRRITSPEQLIPHLKFEHQRSSTPDVVPDTAYLMPQIEEAVKRYLRGVGHPLSAISEDYCDLETFQSEKSDPSLRAKRFVKVLSGLEMLPVEEVKKFKVTIYEDVLDRALFKGQYNRVTSLIPPYPHACLFEIDIWLNQGLIDALESADVPIGEDTQFDWAMHMGVMKMGDDSFQSG